MQTISFFLFRLQESGLGSQDILSEKPWELESFLNQGKKATYFFCVLIIRFRQFGAEKNFINSFSNFPPGTPRIRIRKKKMQIRNPD